MEKIHQKLVPDIYNDEVHGVSRKYSSSFLEGDKRVRNNESIDRTHTLLKNHPKMRKHID